VDILVGDATQGRRYVADHCETCHTTAALQAFTKRFADPKLLQQNWLMPGSGGFGPGLGGGKAPPVTAVVTLPSGERLEGTVDRMDDFTLTLITAGDHQRTVRTEEGGRVVLNDPLKPHKDRLPLYIDSDIHNVTAYLASLRESK
jgi:cytochrome c oxidase cbb3-type subunit 3